MERIRRGYKQTEIGEIPEDWEVVRLGEIANIKTGPFGAQLHESDYVKYGTPIITVEHLGDFGITYKEDTPMVSDEDKSRLKQYILEEDDIVFSRVGSIDRNALIQEYETGWLFSGRLLRIRLKKGISARYVSFYFKGKSFQDRIKSVAVGQTMASLNTAILKNVLVILPPLDEQRRIAEAFSDADAQIMALAGLIAKKRDIKHGTMQRLLTGQQRLAGFSGEWEVVRLGDKDITLKFVNGGTPSTQIKDYWNGAIPWITGGDIVDQKILSIRWYISEDAVKNSSTNVIREGNLLIVTRTGVGKLAIAPSDIAISQDLTGVYLNQQRINIEFLFRYLDLMSNHIRNLNQGTSIEGITRETLANIKIHLPPLDEQIAIARVLSDMDAEIEALQTKHDKLVMIKQGMMHELLTGKVRL